MTVSQLANIEELAGDMIDSVEEDLVREVFQNTAGLPAEILPYGVNMVEAPAVWEKNITGEKVRVCVIDSGNRLQSSRLRPVSLKGGIHLI